MPPPSFFFFLSPLEATGVQCNENKRFGKLTVAFKCKLLITGIPGKCIVRALIKSRGNNDIPLGLGASARQPFAVIRQLWKHIPQGSSSPRSRLHLEGVHTQTKTVPLGVRWGGHRIICWEAVL